MKKSLGFMLLIFLMFVVLRLVGLTYGFYNTRIIGNASDYSVSVVSDYVSATYSEGVSRMIFKNDYLFPGDTAEKTFVVTNDGDKEVVYSILIDNVVNTFERTQDLRYTLYINDEVVSEGAINHSEKQYLYYNRVLPLGDFDYVKFVFKYAETEESQNMDMDKILSFRFNITNAMGIVEENVGNILNLNINNDVLTGYQIYGNSVLNATAGDYLSVGELVKDEMSSNFGKYNIPIVLNNKNYNIYLNQPLRKIDEYTDYLDFKEQRVYSYIEKIILNGQEELVQTNTFDDGSIGVALTQYGIKANTTVLSNGLSSLIYSDFVLGSAGVAATSINDGYLYLSIKDVSLKSVDDYKTYFANKYSEGNPIVIYAVKSEVDKFNVYLPSLNIVNGANSLIVNSSVLPLKVSVLYNNN